MKPSRTDQKKEGEAAPDDFPSTIEYGSLKSKRMANAQAEGCKNVAEPAAPCTIRPFLIEDLKQILEIEREAFPKTGYPKEVILNYAKRLPGGFIVVETGNQIVGYMIFDQTGHVYSAAVRPSHRRRGFGKMLFSNASEQSLGKLWLEVRSKNTEAIAFYHNIGMRIVGRVQEYYHGDDALVMILDALGEGRVTSSGESR